MTWSDQTHRAAKLVALLSFACGVVPGCAALAVGPRMVDDTVVARARALEDADLLDDVKSLHNDRLRGRGELQAGMCLQQYVRGRAAEAELTRASDERAQAVARSEMMSGYATCAAQCRLATDLTSKYTPIASKYVERCEAGANASEQAIGIEHVRRLVAVLEDAVQPLELFLAHKDATEAIEHLRDQNMADEALEALAAEVQALHDVSAEAIERGSKFYYSAPAQENLRLRAQLEAEIGAVERALGELEMAVREAKDAGRSDDVQTLQLTYVAQGLHLQELVDRNAELQAQYERMAADVGVYVRPAPSP